MKPYGSKRSFDTEPRIKSARALVKREGEDLIEEQSLDSEDDFQVYSDPSKVMTRQEVEALIMSRPTAARNLGRYEGFALAVGLLGMADGIRANRCAECGERFEKPYTKAGTGSPQWCSIGCAHFK